MERLWPLGLVPGFIGVLGGRCLSKTSGDSIGPNVTLLRDRLLIGPLSSALVTGTKSYTIAESLALLRGDGETVVSSSSLIDMREELRDRTEERLVKEDSREGMGVGTFSEEEREVRARAAFGVCAKQ